MRSKFPVIPCKYCGGKSTFGTCGFCHGIKSALSYFFTTPVQNKKVVLKKIIKDVQVEQVQKKLDKGED